MDNSAINFLEKLQLSNKIFVDVGANDGETNSMTFTLEKNGWNGLLIEPNPILIVSLQVKRKSKIINCAVSNSEEPLEFCIVSGPNNLHGLSRFNYSPEFEMHVKKHSGSIEKKIVECHKLNNLLSTNNIPNNFSFLKVDVEGHELEVFKSLNFNSFQPALIVAEDNTKDLDKKVRHFLQANGYVVIARMGTNNYFVRSENVFRFIPSFLMAKAKFLRWDLKRIIWKIFGKEFTSKNV
jgi:FkbM family methyltransferase